MERDKLEHFKKKLIEERERINNTLFLMRKNDTIDSNQEISSELSFYDNHPSDLASELYDMERGRALKENEVSIMKKIDDAIESIDEGNYGICRQCGAQITEDRLEFIPYALYCIKCQNSQNEKMPFSRKDRPNEEKVFKNSFGYGYNRYQNTGFDIEDSYQSVARYDNRRFTPDYFDDVDDEVYTDPIERISNEQYKNQLPD